MAYTDEDLRSLCNTVEAKPPDWVSGWRQGAAALLREVAQAPPELRRSREFQRKLWESEAITSTGMGSVKVDVALDDEDFREWLATEAMAPLPEGKVIKAAHIKTIFDRLVAQFEGRRTPWLKILRLLSALFPTEFTTLASRRLLHEIAGWFLADPPKGALAVNRAIVGRLNDVLGPVAHDDYDALAARMSLPWLMHLHRSNAETEEDVTEVVTNTGEAKLKPLPAARRRKGMTASRGYFQSVLAMLQAVEGGLTREDFIDFLRTEQPGKKDSSHGTTISVLQGELGVVYRDGRVYKLTPSGRAVLETGDPDELAKWLLTRILGFDLALIHVRDHGPIRNTDLLRAIQKANPGWTGTVAPSAIVGWCNHLGLFTPENRLWVLTERGREWAKQIHWEPAILEPIDEPDGADEPDEEEEALTTDVGGIQKSPFDELYAGLTYNFPRALVAELHAGLWAHPRRHFAVLTGLSGAGKTQLARQYGLALAGGGEAARARVKIIAVQPGWYDPGPLLGYVNPIQPTAYVRTPVLEFLRQAVSRPEAPHVLILDEMNLSRPEQYLAPLLSAMETGDRIDLHSEGDMHDGVEKRIPYPSNLVIIGTVNMDETTHGLSDKVLDRAFTLEFWDIDINDYAGWDRTNLGKQDTERLRTALTELMQALVPARLHFGWRVVDDVVDFLARNQEHGGQLEFDAALDAIVYAKIVPKLRGDDSPRFRAALDETKKVAKRYKLERCLSKLEELEHDLTTTGSARFWR
ncbi:5-methylcytosine-specific restriction enzyme B [Enhygromyxa salina]|uniref:5-methylcytosine-specific restriction enzyme B n=1 Tax=Enhygromyxa salina TaxID=215803 RepID=A0A2S9XHS4_9BACT|nr:restriction endonuclease [Enhygromyxa salina]PRP92412.1 5-methylcytosine-specific restriction enzyme B [Enhygromyxa salina]